MKISMQQLLNQSKDYVMIVFGLFLCAFSFAAFVIPENVVTGGVTGIATIIYYASGRTINIAIPNYIINVILLVAAYKVVGRQFVIRTIFGATVFSIFLGILCPIFKEPFVEQQSFMNIIIGAVLCGVGLGITFSHGGRSGGSDVIVAMVNIYSIVSFGCLLLFCDLFIIFSFLFLGGSSIYSSSAGSYEKASPARVSITIFIHSICIIVIGDKMPMNGPIILRSTAHILTLS